MASAGTPAFRTSAVAASAPPPKELVEPRVHRRPPLFGEAEAVHHRLDQPAVRVADDEVVLAEAAGAEDLHAGRHDLGVGLDPFDPDDVEVELPELAEATALRTLVAEQARDREPLDRLGQPLAAGGDHPRQRRRHLRPQGDFPAAPVLEGVQLADDLLTRLAGVELQGLDDGRVVLLEAESERGVAPAVFDPAADPHLLGVVVAHPGERADARHADLPCPLALVMTLRRASGRAAAPPSARTARPPSRARARGALRRRCGTSP